MIHFVISGLKSFGELKEQWEKLTVIFTRIATLIEIALGKPDQLFRKKAVLALEERIMTGRKLTQITKNSLARPAEKAIHVSMVVNKMSSLYVSLSSGHLLPMLSNLGKGLHLKPEIESDALQIQKLQELILLKADEATVFVDSEVKSFENSGFMEKLDSLEIEQEK